MSNLETLPPMSNEEFDKAIKDLQDLWNLYKSTNKRNKNKEIYYQRYLKKLKEIAGNTHMEIEDITMHMS